MATISEYREGIKKGLDDYLDGIERAVNDAVRELEEIKAGSSKEEDLEHAGNALAGLKDLSLGLF